MPGAFWTSWQLWEKLCFCLGSAIVLVILLGCFKLIYNHWRLRKYTKIAATRAALKPQMQHSPSVRCRRGREVPFGVRALESGIEVDGVWISGSNTPANSVTASPQVAAKIKASCRDTSPARTSSASNISRIEMPQPSHPYPKSMLPSGTGKRDSGEAFDSRILRPHEPPPTSDHQARGQATYQPRRSSRLRYSDSLNPEDGEVIAATEDSFSVGDQNGKRPEETESEAEDQDHPVSWSGSSNNDYHDVTGQGNQAEQSSAFLHPAYHNSSRGREPASYELNGTSPVGPNNHNAHVNETGHLLVRNRNNGMTVAYDHMQDIPSKLDTTVSQKTGDPFATPDGSPPDDRIPAFDLDEDSVNYHSELMSHREVTYPPDHAEPLRPFDGNRQLRISQVVRKVNSGFEILRPGTLDAPPQSSDSSEWAGDGAGKKRYSRRLQKRNRANSYSLEEP